PPSLSLLPYTPLFRSRVDALRPAVSAVRCGIMHTASHKIREIVAKVAGNFLRSFRALPISRDNDILVLRDHLKQISASDFCRMQDRKSTRLNSSHVSI